MPITNPPCRALLRLSSALCVVVLASGAKAQAPAWAATAGALTPYDPTDAVDIADFCSGDPEDDATTCARDWVAEGQRRGVHLRASAGVYRIARELPLFSGMHLRCDNATDVVFRKADGSTYPHLAEYDDTELVDVSIIGCGFDMAGDPRNFAASVLFGGGRNITIRDNRFFDSTGVRHDARDKQRQYIAATNAQDVVLERNRLSEGGRIKVGRPGRRILIRHNHLDFINDNGITVVARTGTELPDGSNVTEDIWIEGNLIKDPTVTGIFFGADGQRNGVGVSVRRVTIIDNIIVGNISTACLKGTLPLHSEQIYIARNQCLRQSATFSWETKPSKMGFNLSRTDDVPAGHRATNITLQDNKLHAIDRDLFRSSAIFLDGVEVCLVGNQTRLANTSVWARRHVAALVHGNDWGDGLVGLGFRGVTAGVTVEPLQDASQCYRPAGL